MLVFVFCQRFHLFPRLFRRISVDFFHTAVFFAQIKIVFHLDVTLHLAYSFVQGVFVETALSRYLVKVFNCLAYAGS